MAYEDGDNLVDGPALGAWIRERIDPCPSLERRLREWAKEGTAAPLATLDYWLNVYGFHPSELPDEMWIPSQRHCRSCGEDIGLRKRSAVYCPRCRKRYQQGSNGTRQRMKVVA